MNPYRRVLLKMSGEILKSETAIFDPECFEELAHSLSILLSEGVQIGLVVGGGNVLRGGRGHFSELLGRVVADDVGMMATVVNTLALTGYFRQRGIATSAYGAFGIPHVVDSFCLHSVLEDLEEGTIVIFCGGTGLPFFTTDSAAAVRAAQIRADILFKLTDVDGVYERDPKTDPDAQRLECLSFDEALSRHIRVMDPTAFALCRETNTPIFVFKMSANNSIVEVVRGRGRGTLISGRER